MAEARVVDIEKYRQQPRAQQSDRAEVPERKVVTVDVHSFYFGPVAGETKGDFMSFRVEHPDLHGPMAFAASCEDYDQVLNWILSWPDCHRFKFEVVDHTERPRPIEELAHLMG